MQITQEDNPVTVTMPGSIKFANNQELMLHINRKYTDKNFYVMNGPVANAVSGEIIEAITRKCRTMADLEPFNGVEMKFIEGTELLENIVEPIIEEIVDGSPEKDIYLHCIVPVGPVINPETKTPRMCYMVRGYF